MSLLPTYPPAAFLSSDLYFHSIVDIPLSEHISYCQLDSTRALSSNASYTLCSESNARLAPHTSSGALPLPNTPKLCMISNFLHVLMRVSEMQFYLKYRRNYTPADNFYVIRLPDYTLSFHPPAKSRRHFQLPQFLFGVNKLSVLIDSRRHSS